MSDELAENLGAALGDSWSVEALDLDALAARYLAERRAREEEHTAATQALASERGKWLAAEADKLRLVIEANEAVIGWADAEARYSRLVEAVRQLLDPPGGQGMWDQAAEYAFDRSSRPRRVEISVSPTGRSVRVFVDGEEIK